MVPGQESSLRGVLGDPAGVPVLTEFLVRYREGGFRHGQAFDALLGIGKPAVAPVIGLMKYSALAEASYLFLLELDREDLREAVAAGLDDPPPSFGEAIALAEVAEEVFGTAELEETLQGFYGAIAADSRQPEPFRSRAGEALVNLAKTARSPLTKEAVISRYAEIRRNAAREEEREELLEKSRLENRRRARAAERAEEIREEKKKEAAEQARQWREGKWPDRPYLGGGYQTKEQQEEWEERREEWEEEWKEQLKDQQEHLQRQFERQWKKQRNQLRR